MDTFHFDALSYSSDTLVQVTLEIFLKVRTPTACLHANLLPLSCKGPPDHQWYSAHQVILKGNFTFPPKVFCVPNHPQRKTSQRAGRLLTWIEICLQLPWLLRPRCFLFFLTPARAQFDFVNRLKLSVVKLKKFILCVRSCMFDNPYHNWFHAFDVTQVSSSMMKSSTVVGRESQACKTICPMLPPL